MKTKIDLKYLKKNLNLKKFISFLDNNTKDWGNDEAIYYDFLTACETDEISENELFNELNNWGKLNEKLYDGFFTGKFLPLISDNFKLEDISEVIGPKLTEVKQHHYIHQIISSKINKSFYVLVYQGFDLTNDGYYCRKKFSNIKKAKNFIKEEQKKIEIEINKKL